MNDAPNSLTSRREFIKTTGRLAAASALAGVALPQVHAAGKNEIQIALVGCGGRGSGAAENALTNVMIPAKLVAMADVFDSKLSSSYEGLKGKCKDKVEVPDDHKFIGFDGYMKAMDLLKPGDVVILTTPLAFRWVHFSYAINKGLNVFMEKPLTADGPSSRKMMKLAEDASAKNLKVGVGLMSRHKRGLQELNKRIADGEIGDIILMRGYRMAGPLATAFSTKYPGGDCTELLWQIKRFHSFIWASGGCYNDFYIHHLDQLCWMKNAWPVKAQALGGRHYKNDPNGNPYVDQNFDTYSVEYTFADGTKMMMDGRCVTGCNDIYSSYAHGSKGMAIVAKSGDYNGPAMTFKSQNAQRSNLIWQSKGESEDNPYVNEWNDLMEAIRDDKPYNEVKRGVEASVVSNMGRIAAHTGQEILFEDTLNSDVEYAPGVDKFTMDSPPPVRSGPDGRYPVPMPGLTKKTEYEIASADSASSKPGQ